MPIFITKISNAEFLTNFKVAELEHEFEPGDLGYRDLVNWVQGASRHKPTL